MEALRKVDGKMNEKNRGMKRAVSETRSEYFGEKQKPVTNPEMAKTQSSQGPENEL